MWDVTEAQHGLNKRTRQKSKLQLDSAVFESKKNSTNESSPFKREKENTIGHQVMIQFISK